MAETEVLKTPEVWQKELGITIKDPDGWRRDKTSWDEPISRQDFKRRAAQSTCVAPKYGNGD